MPAVWVQAVSRQQEFNVIQECVLEFPHQRFQDGRHEPLGPGASLGFASACKSCDPVACAEELLLAQLKELRSGFAEGGGGDELLLTVCR